MKKKLLIPLFFLFISCEQKKQYAVDKELIGLIWMNGYLRGIQASQGKTSYETYKKTYIITSWQNPSEEKRTYDSLQYINLIK